MAQPIYKLRQGRFTEAWHQLAEQEQQRLLSLVPEALKTAGGKELVICSAAWSNDLNWARYIESRSTLGVELILPGNT